MSTALALRPAPPSVALPQDLLAAARARLAREGAAVIRVDPATPPALREAMLSVLADEGVAAVRPIAERVRAEAWREAPGESPWNFSWRLAQRLLEAVHDLVEYQPDPVVDLYDFFARVPETLRPRRGTPRSRLTGRTQGLGDCEDMSTVTVALLRAVGLRARPVWIDQPGAFQNHVAVEVFLPSTTYPSGAPVWAESTIEGARVGEHPVTVVERLGHGARVFGGSA